MLCNGFCLKFALVLRAPWTGTAVTQQQCVMALEALSSDHAAVFVVQAVQMQWQPQMPAQKLLALPLGHKPQPVWTIMPLQGMFNWFVAHNPSHARILLYLGVQRAAIACGTHESKIGTDR